jgi:glycine/D-amino acid oxidase-like deaminating enzyme
MQRARLDTLIIGQGLAGSALAWHLSAAGQRVCVIDDDHRGASSRVAAGLINPLAGMRFNRRPQVHAWLAAAEDWYASLARQFGQTYLHPLPLLRLYRSTRQRRFYQRRRDDPDSRDLLGSEFGPTACPEPIVAEHGGFTQLRTGYVDLPALLDSMAQWLRGIDALVSRALAYEQVLPVADGVGVGDLSADRLVFCDGARLRHNPWFDWLPLAPDKGEIIDIDDSAWRPRHIVNGAHWLVPVAGGGLRFGSTHDHDTAEDRPTAAARAALLAGYRALRPDADGVVVRRHLAGTRPATADRYPLLGRHPQHAALWVCNGFGARGALSIPWYTLRMAEHLVHGRPLPAEADIRRVCAGG